MTTQEQADAGALTDDLIAKEVAIQDRMWGDANERADATNCQMIKAGVAQASLVVALAELRPGGISVAETVEVVKALVYPPDWDGFRSYGSNVANLVVGAAFLRSEIKRRILLGEDTTRTKRGEPYKVAQPYVSSEEALAELAD